MDVSHLFPLNQSWKKEKEGGKREELFRKRSVGREEARGVRPTPLFPRMAE